MTTIDANGKLSRAELGQYWSGLSEKHLSKQDDGLAAICYAGMPAWFNRFLDVYQRKALAHLLADEDFTGRRILDIGTGVGRWARWYAGRAECEVVGIDIEPVRLGTAGEYSTRNITYLQMPANQLAFPDGSFDVVNSITVLQHVDHDVKREAIAEFGRVVKPGGKAVIFEITDEGDDASHVYPWAKDTWIDEFHSRGFILERTTGDQYIPALRLMKKAYQVWQGDKARTGIDLMKSADPGKRSKGMLLPLQVATMVSYPIEEVARFLPTRYARITGFLFTRA